MSTGDKYTSIKGTRGYRTAGPVYDYTGRKGQSGFGCAATAEQVSAGYVGAGRVAIVTGAGSGLGTETARVLALRGVDVVMAVRNVAAGEKVAEDIRAKQPGAKLTVMQLDLASLASVRAFAQAFLATGKQLNVLLENAGVMASPHMLSADGHEMQFATNHLGHFLLVKLLLPHMIEVASQQSVQGRIVVTSSYAHTFPYKEGIRSLDTIDSPQGYTPWAAYGQSKLANVLFARELAARLQGKPVAVASLHPGGIRTNLSRHVEASMGSILKFVMETALSPLFKTIPQGASTQVYLATAPEIVAGEYYVDNNLAASSPLAHDAVLGRQLWDMSEKLVA